jgi:hypothetical protein
MKERLFITVAVVFFSFFAARNWGIENPAVTNPAGFSTIPPSSIRSGLISNANPIDTNGNLLVTGNVRRGMHFRGTVPYGSTTTFRAGLGSSSLSSFLRDSAGIEDFGRYATGYRVQPYYSRTETVATTRPGYSGVFRPVSTRIENRILQRQLTTGVNGAGLEEQDLSGIGTSGSDLEWRGSQAQYGTPAKPIKIVHSIRELQLLTRDEAGISPRLDDASRQQRQNEQLLVERYQKQNQDPRLKTQDLMPETEEAGKVFGRESIAPNLDQKQKSAEKYVLSEPLSQNRINQRFESTKPDFSPDVFRAERELAFPDRPALDTTTDWQLQIGESKLDEDSPELQVQTNRIGSDVLERLRQQIDDLTRAVDARLQTETDDTRKDQRTTTGTVGSPGVTTTGGGEIGRLYEPIKPQTEQAVDGREDFGLEFSETPNPVGGEPARQTGASAVQSSNGLSSGIYEEKSSPLDELNKLSREELSARANQIRGPLTNPESYPEAKFDRHIRSAEYYLKTGRYYASADAFSLASIYKRNDPLCLAGRGQALFAAGEYVSSALFLSRAFEIAPEYARMKIDFATILGDENRLESRIADVKEWSGRSGSGRLEFLLGYVYYQMGRLGPARQAINAAFEKMPKSPAIAVVKTAIDDAIAAK